MPPVSTSPSIRLTSGVALFGKLVPRLQVPDDELSVIRHPPEVYLVDEREELPSRTLRHDPGAPDPLKNID